MADNSWFWAVFQHIFPLIIIKILRNNFVFLLHGFILSPSWDIIVCVFVTHSWRCPEHLGSGREKHQILSELIFRWSYLSGIYQAARAPEDWYPFWSNAEVSKKIGQEVQKVRCILARALNIEFLSPAEECRLGWGSNKAPLTAAHHGNEPSPKPGDVLPSPLCCPELLCLSLVLLLQRWWFQGWFWHWIPSLGKSITSYFSNGVKQSLLVCLLV